MEMNIEQRKEEYIKKKYTKLANDILTLIDTPEKLKSEVKLNLYGLWQIYHYLDTEIDWMQEILQSENATKLRRLPRCDSCDDIRHCTSPTF